MQHLVFHCDIVITRISVKRAIFSLLAVFSACFAVKNMEKTTETAFVDYFPDLTNMNN